MLPNPALEKAAEWVPGVVSLALFIIVFVAWLRIILGKIRSSEERIIALEKERSKYVRVKELRGTVNGIWTVVRQVDRQLYGMRLVLRVELPQEERPAIPGPAAEEEDDDD